jgi:hypothetical protein
MNLVEGAVSPEGVHVKDATERVTGKASLRSYRKRPLRGGLGSHQARPSRVIGQKVEEKKGAKRHVAAATERVGYVS